MSQLTDRTWDAVRVHPLYRAQAWAATAAFTVAAAAVAAVLNRRSHP